MFCQQCASHDQPDTKTVWHAQNYTAAADIVIHTMTTTSEALLEVLSKHGTVAGARAQQKV